jgi:energy-converting hydrogenase Eha subunit C
MTAQLDKPATEGSPRWSSGGLSVAVTGGMSAEAVLAALDTTAAGLSHAEAVDRAAVLGPNAVRTHQVRAWSVLGRQLRSALLVLLVVTATIAVIVGVVLPFSPLSHLLGFRPLAIGFFAVLAAMVVAYLALIEVAKRVFFADPAGRLPLPRRRHAHHVQRRASRFTYPGPRRTRPRPHG